MDPRDTHDLGRLYWHRDRREKSWKPVQVSRSQMVEEPFRRGLGLFLGLPGVKTGIAVGWWGRATEDELGMRTIGEHTEEVRGWPNKPDYDRTWTRLAEIEQRVRDDLI